MLLFPDNPRLDSRTGRSGQFGFAARSRWRCIVLSPAGASSLGGSPDRWHQVGVSHSQRCRCSAVAEVHAATRLERHAASTASAAEQQQVPALGSRVTNMSQSTRKILLGIVAYLAACLADTTGAVLLCGWYCGVCPIDVEHCRRLDGDVLHEEERGLARPLCPPVRAPTLDLNPRVRTMRCEPRTAACLNRPGVS
jgi:hypothetical protein